MVNKNTNKKYQYVLLLSLSAFIGSLLLIFLGIKPLYIKASNLKQERIVKLNNLEELQAKKNKLAELSAKEEQLKLDAEKVEAALPKANQVGRLFIQISEMAKANNGNARSVQELAGVSNTQATTENISKITYSTPLEFKSYFDFKNFITSSENALKIMDIVDIDVKAGETGNFTSTLTANTYMRSK